MILFKDFGCRIIADAKGRLPRLGLSRSHAFPSPQFRHAACCKTVCGQTLLGCLTTTGELYFWHDGVLYPVCWEIHRRDFGVRDLNLEQAPADGAATVVVVGNDGLVYRATVKIVKMVRNR